MKSIIYIYICKTLSKALLMWPILGAIPWFRGYPPKATNTLVASGGTSSASAKPWAKGHGIGPCNTTPRPRKWRCNRKLGGQTWWFCDDLVVYCIWCEDNHEKKWWHMRRYEKLSLYKLILYMLSIFGCFLVDLLMYTFNECVCGPPSFSFTFIMIIEFSQPRKLSFRFSRCLG